MSVTTDYFNFCMLSFIGYPSLPTTITSDEINFKITGVEFNRNYSVNSTSISWDLSPLNNPSNFDTGIFYHLEIYNLTCGDTWLLVRECCLNESFYVDTILSPYYIYKAVISATISNTEGARNGMPSLITGITNY